MEQARQRVLEKMADLRNHGLTDREIAELVLLIGLDDKDYVDRVLDLMSHDKEGE